MKSRTHRVTLRLLILTRMRRQRRERRAQEPETRRSSPSDSSAHDMVENTKQMSGVKALRDLWF